MSTMTCTRQRWDLRLLQPMLSQMLKQYISFGQSAYQCHVTTETKPQGISREPMSQLPPEIIRIILLHLLSTSRCSFLQALQVSQSWAEVGTPLLWRHISLDIAHISRFTQNLSQPSHSTRFIQSLTLSTTMNITPEADLTSLSQTMNQLENLTTFSLSLDSNLFCEAPPISNLLKSLPSSVTALEIARLPPRLLCKTASERVCHSIQHLLPQLEHLRIDRGQVCTNILPNPDPENMKLLLPRLKSVLINDSNRSITSGHCCGLRDMRQWRTDLLGEEIALKARKLIDAGCAPSLESFVVLTTCPYQIRAQPRTPSPSPSSLPLQSGGNAVLSQQHTPPTNSHARKSFLPSAASSFFLRKDVLGNKTTLYPYCAAPHAQQKWVVMRHYYADPASAASATVAFERKKGKNAHFIGNIREIRTILEGQQMWLEMSTGARFPPSFRQTRQGRTGDHFTWIQPSMLANRTLDSQHQDEGLGYLTEFDENDDDYDILTPVTYDGLLRPY